MPKQVIYPPEVLLDAARRFNRASFTRIKTVSSENLSHSEWYLMWTLLHWPDTNGAKPSELAQRQRVTAGSVAQQLSQLEKKAMIERSHSDNDRRVVLVKLTAQGRKKLKKVRSEFVNQYKKLINYLGPKESEHLIRLLTDSANYLEITESESC